MECVEEELSEAQQNFFKKKQDEFKVYIRVISYYIFREIVLSLIFFLCDGKYENIISRW